MTLIRKIFVVVSLFITSQYPAVSGHAGFWPRTPFKWDAFSHIPCAEEALRVDNYGNELRKQPSDLGVVIIYAGCNDTRRGEVVARLFGIRDRLVTNSSIDPKRIVILDGGFREKLDVQLWIPEAQPLDSVMELVNSEISAKDVRIKAPRISKWEYKCRDSR